MQKIAFLLMACASVASANFVQNGDFSAGLANWTYWNAPWGSVSVDDAGCPNPGNPAPCAYHQVNGGGSGGLYQIVNVPIGVQLTLDADWTGDVSAPGWAEVMLWDYDGVTDPAATADAGAAGDIAAKKDGWGLNPPAAWGWESIQNSPVSGFTIVSATGQVVIATKAGANPGSPWMCVDNISLVPEPASALLLGLPLLFVRRRR